MSQVAGSLNRSTPPSAPKADKPPAAPADKVHLQGNESPKQLFARLKEPGFVVARGLGKATTFWVPGGLPEKLPNQGLDSDHTTH